MYEDVEEEVKEITKFKNKQKKMATKLAVARAKAECDTKIAEMEAELKVLKKGMPVDEEPYEKRKRKEKARGRLVGRLILGISIYYTIAVCAICLGGGNQGLYTSAIALSGVIGALAPLIILGMYLLYTAGAVLGGGEVEADDPEIIIACLAGVVALGLLVALPSMGIANAIGMYTGIL